MTVQELIDLLEECNPDAKVVLATQSHYPIEHELGGFTLRREVARTVGDLSVDDDTENLELDEVILVEGAWRGYGFKEAWTVAVRR